MDDKFILDTPITNEEIKTVVMNCNPDKAPGPDGFPARFFQTFWSTVHLEVCVAVHHFFLTGKLPLGVSSSFITFIPKTGNAFSPKDYRPIALCNLIYKIISKILAVRLALVLPKLVRLEQNTFIKGRKIQDAIIMGGHEMISEFTNKHPTMALKANISKAFDSVSWSFLLKIMVTAGFIAQGMITLSHTALKAHSSICHTFFVNDLLITCKASIPNARTLQEIFQIFRAASGLQINYQSLKKPHCSVLLDKISNKINDWCNGMLSVAGKTELIKTVITPTCLYWCSVFTLPISVLNQIQKLCRDFIWGSRDTLKKMHLLSWDVMCRPKAEGGLGIQKLIDVQQAAQCTLAWDFILSKDRIWVPWFKNRYSSLSTYWNAVPKISHSILWKNLINIRDVMHLNIKFSIGNGQIFKLLSDPWCEGHSLLQKFGHRIVRRLGFAWDSFLSSLMDNGGWNLHILQDTIFHPIRDYIQTLVIHDREDKYTWDGGSFSFKNAWKGCRVMHPEVLWYRMC
ncbi:uncharacterized protein LOC132305131 [Cornus florida]|uniref:uncharacterized protein LOC132305131 n=1 Tax=Cornus florida TaxID=4283 RepID=UPI0028A2768E|nr:uncharacterized protein LOC132305131 [Cornus florida]